MVLATENISNFIFQPIIIRVGLIIGVVVLAIIFNLIFSYFFNKIDWRAKNKYYFLYSSSWKHIFTFLFTLFLLYLIEPFLKFSEKFTFYSNLLTISSILVFSWVAIRMIYILRDYAISRNKLLKKDTFSARSLYTKMNVLIKIITVIIAIIGVAYCLMLFPKIHRLGLSLLASAGVAGLLVGFAAQKSLSNILSGIQVAFTQPIRINDTVIVEGEWGIIEEITLTYVVIHIWDNRRLIVPVNYFLEKPFQNWTRSSTELLGIVYIRLDYTAPILKIREVLDDILKTTDLWDGKTKSLQITDLTEQTMEVRILASASDASKAWDLRCYIREKMIEFLQQNYPSCLPKTRFQIYSKI